MPTYLFSLGREQDLSLAELTSVFASRDLPFSPTKIAKGQYTTEIADEIDIIALSNMLGGTVLVAKLVHDNIITAEEIADVLDAKTTTGKLIFSLHASKKSTPLALETKKILKQRGRSVRYIPPKNTATIIHNKLVQTGGDIHLVGGKLYRTVAVQDIEGFTHRDYSRPRIDSVSGMSPPKLSRIMVNLAGGNSVNHLHDAFCGSGTILMEALHMGVPLLSGSDLSPKAVDDTDVNLTWLAKETNNASRLGPIFVCDATVLDTKLEQNSLDAIVSEPYMGKPLKGNESRQTLQRRAEELHQLYQETLHSFARVLKPGGKVVMIFPSLHWRGTWMPTMSTETIKNAGFTPTVFLGKTILRYHRADQHLARDIQVLTLA